MLLHLLTDHAPVWLAGILGAGIISAVMGSDTHQVLAVSTMFTKDVFAHYGGKAKYGERGSVHFARGFIVVVTLIAYVVALITPASIFEMAVRFAFSGFAAMAPVMIAALFWKRSTKYGALASTLWVAALAAADVVPAKHLRRHGAGARQASVVDLPRARPSVRAHHCERDRLWLPAGGADGAGLRAVHDRCLSADAPAERGDHCQVFPAANERVARSGRATRAGFRAGRLPGAVKSEMSLDPTALAAAQDQLDAHVREIIAWHFSPETGCPFWLDWARKAGWDPRQEVKSFADLARSSRISRMNGCASLQPEVWVPAQFKGRPFNIFETGGTTGMPKQRIGWDDYKTDYEEFSAKLSDEHFPRGARLADGRPDRPAPPAPGHRAPRQLPRQPVLLR